MRSPLPTDDDDERRTIQDGRQSRSSYMMDARNMPSLRWADTGPVEPVAWRPPRCRVVVVWRCTPPGGRAVLSEVCGRVKSAFARFRHATTRNQHPRSRVSSRRLRGIIDSRLGGSSAAAPGKFGSPPPSNLVNREMLGSQWRSEFQTRALVRRAAGFSARHSRPTPS